MLTKIANLKLAATNAAFWQSEWSGTLVIECFLNLCVLIDVSDLEVFEEIWSFNKWSHSCQLHSVSCSWLAVSKTGWCPAIQFESGECTLGNPGGNTSILSEEAVEATRHHHVSFMWLASCSDRQVLTLGSRSNNILRSNLLTRNSPTRSVFSDPCVNSMPQLLTQKRTVSAGHVHQRAAFPGNNLHPLHVSEPWLQCSRWQWSGLPQMCAIANTSLLH